ncbi:hypothetical protein VKT23_017258 [Stygiomarasmius scandens]|uniref:Survival protein SurE-like phosphatase/nucleotidase domain-containing protein n=1 Tax=Marasmiellus scandens TaxID=2682957 RepID=A0ABR1ISI2_9AGAR
MIRAQNDALKEAGYDVTILVDTKKFPKLNASSQVVLSCPADNRSGTGSSTAPPTVLTQPCEFNTCPAGSPPEGLNASDPRINYVNSFPVDAVRFGIQTLAPMFFDGSGPDFVVSGSNVGNNLGPNTVMGSGTVGAACEAAKEGIPSTAFSAATASQVSFTTLETDPTSDSSVAALIYADLTVKFVNQLLAGSGPILPPNVTVNVNYPSTTRVTSTGGRCLDPEDFHFILTRIDPNPSAGTVDVERCGSTTLPGEANVVALTGCFTSVSVFNATTKTDVDASTQAFVVERLGDLLECLPESE